MVESEIVQEWLSKAKEDFDFGLVNLGENKPFYAQICFHFQQAAEKFLKAYIVAKELEFARLHDLPRLLKICAEDDPAFEDLREDCEYLTTYYIETRYPVYWPTNFSVDETRKAFESAARIKRFVE